VTEQSQGKGRPTPKRSEAQKRRGGPVTPPPTSRREAAKQLRAKQAEQRAQVRRGYATGDDSVLLPRDRGPARKIARDVIDGRRNVATLLLPVAVVVIVVGLTRNLAAEQLTFGIWLATLVGALLDMVFAGILLSTALKTALPGEKRRGHVAYGLMRSTALRRLRKPVPQVAPGPLLPGRRRS
jgi:hypothetical protein